MKIKVDIKQEKAARLFAARKAVFKSRRAAVDALHINYDTYKSHEYGKNEFYSEDAAKYAQAFRTNVAHLLCLDLLVVNKTPATLQPDAELPTYSIPVYGQAAGGVWLEGELQQSGDSTELEHILIAPINGYSPKNLYARRVVGNSVSNRIPDGAFAVFVPLESYGWQLQPGKLVDCRRTRAGFYEYSVKVFAGDRLMTDSRELTEQTSIPLNHGDEDTIVEILGVAVSYQGEL